jgi:hypothetical protein
MARSVGDRTLASAIRGEQGRETAMPESNDGGGRRERGAIGELAHDLRELFKLELELAKTELKGELRRARTAVVLLGSGIVLGTLGVAMLPVALAFGLGLALPLWAAFLLVGIGFLAISGALAYTGAKKLADVDPVPRRAIQTLGDLGDEVAAGRADAVV